MTIADLIKQVSASQRLVDDAMKGLSMNRIQAVMDQAQKIESVLTMAHTCVSKSPMLEAVRAAQKMVDDHERMLMASRRPEIVPTAFAERPQRPFFQEPLLVAPVHHVEPAEEEHTKISRPELTRDIGFLADHTK